MKSYSINDVAIMTGFSTRTLRNYIKTGSLNGEKENGVWKFTEKDFFDFISNSIVAKGLASKRNAQVYDFLLDDKKKENQVCMILDLHDGEDGEKLSEFFCTYINTEKAQGVKFSFAKHGKLTRVILLGEEDVVTNIMKKYYGW